MVKPLNKEHCLDIHLYLEMIFEPGQVNFRKGHWSLVTH